MSKLALRAQAVDIADLPLRQDLLAKNVLMTAQRNFCLGNGPLKENRLYVGGALNRDQWQWASDFKGRHTTLIS
ncbi:MAG: hypothetical protein DRH43_06880 [Deltaproteobacteria bacterium]|nr:MAG: hypothetical protein DRH50_07650 [Deltaproteobacteria bacterium]RLC10188.1 MAG: hypothetical protein DRH43_06880 [Deltaproteobacteria bacterium]